MSTHAKPAIWPAAKVVAAMRAGTSASAELVNHYYSLCIPFYREFLGEVLRNQFSGDGCDESQQGDGREAGEDDEVSKPWRTLCNR